MTATTVWKIKNANPPRRVDVDEALALAIGAFGYESVEAFLKDWSPLRPYRYGWSLYAARPGVTIARALDSAEAGVSSLEETLDDPDYRAGIRQNGGRVALANISELFLSSGRYYQDSVSERVADFGVRLRRIGERLEELGGDVR